MIEGGSTRSLTGRRTSELSPDQWPGQNKAEACAKGADAVSLCSEPLCLLKPIPSAQNQGSLGSSLAPAARAKRRARVPYRD